MATDGAAPGPTLAAPQQSFISGSILQLKLPDGQDPQSVQATIAGVSAPVASVNGTVVVKLPGLPTGDYKLTLSTSTGSTTTDVHLQAPGLPAPPAVYADSFVGSTITQLQQTRLANPSSPYLPALEEIEQKLLQERTNLSRLSEAEARELAYTLAAFQAQTQPDAASQVLALRVEIGYCKAHALLFVASVAAAAASAQLTAVSAASAQVMAALIGTGALIASVVAIRAEYDKLDASCYGANGVLLTDPQGRTDNYVFDTDVVGTWFATQKESLVDAALSVISPVTATAKATLKTLGDGLAKLSGFLNLTKLMQSAAQVEQLQTDIDGLQKERTAPVSFSDVAIGSISDNRVGINLIDAGNGKIGYQAYFLGTPVVGQTPIHFTLVRKDTGAEVASKMGIVDYTPPACMPPFTVAGTHRNVWYLDGSPYETDTIEFYADGNALWTTAAYAGGSTSLINQPLTWSYDCNTNKFKVGQQVFPYDPVTGTFGALSLGSFTLRFEY